MNRTACWRTAFAAGVLLALTPNARAQEAPAQKAMTLDRDVVVHVTMDYLLFLPKDYETSRRKWPLMLFLHGAGETGTDIEKVKTHGPPKIVADKPDFPFILVSPQARQFGWKPEYLKALIDEIVAKYRVDKDRIYCTGLSMGGFGTWDLACRYPNLFAAIAPICGGGDPKEAPKLAKLPIWVFHGGKDPVVPIARSQEMVDAIKAAGGDPMFTIYPDAGHDSWTEAYNDPELYRWLLAQKRGRK